MNASGATGTGLRLATVLWDRQATLGRVRLLSPIPRPARDIFCVGRNYVEHAKARGAEVEGIGVLRNRIVAAGR